LLLNTEEQSRMKTLALIIAGCRGAGLGVLSQNRAGVAMPFAGRYRVIDFALSNCANSGILNVGILNQYHPQALSHHIGTGQPWDMDRRWSGGVTLLMPYQRDGGPLNWYSGTADALYKNLDFVLEQNPDAVLVLPGTQVYKMDFAPLLQHHQEHEADVTICVTQMASGKTSQFGSIIAGQDGRVRELVDWPPDYPYVSASTGMLVFRTEVLAQRLTQDARLLSSMHDLSSDVLAYMLEKGDRLYTYPFEGYWVNLHTVEEYWQANMHLLLPTPPLNLQDRDWCIYTRSEGRPPVTIHCGAAVSNSLITNGCTIEGQIENSVLSPGVRVRSGALVRDSIIFDDCEIGADAIVNRAILDKNVVVGQNAHVGCDRDYVLRTSDADGFAPGIALVAQDTHLPPGFCLESNHCIHSDLTIEHRLADAFSSTRWDDVESGETIVEPVFAARF
jgi:glucose-1-phosphate adenylyltransferase